MSKIARASFVAVATALAFTTVFAEETNWTNRLTLKGDARLRYERIDEDGRFDRNRMRFRARLGLSAEIYDDVKFIVQVASGGDNPVSTNQSFDDGFSTKDIGIDLAYVEWVASDQVTLFGGKMKNPLYRPGGAHVIWDGDLNPEGLAAQFKSGNFFGAVGGFSVEERSSDKDSLLFAIQAGMNVTVGDGGKLVAGVGYFSYTDTVGNPPFFDGSAKGNSVDLAGNYLFDYENIELFAQYTMKVADRPLRVFAQFTQNNEVSQEDSAYAVGAKLGSAKEKGSSQYSWTYQDIDADSVIGTFTDSDFGGGGTDASGHVLKAKYMLRDKISVGGALYVNEVDRFQGTEHDYSRIQLDVEFKFD